MREREKELEAVFSARLLTPLLIIITGQPQTWQVIDNKKPLMTSIIHERKDDIERELETVFNVRLLTPFLIIITGQPKTWQAIDNKKPLITSIFTRERIKLRERGT